MKIYELSEVMEPTVELINSYTVFVEMLNQRNALGD
jgi:hypothetical protein